MKIQTKTTLINNKRIQSLVLNAPQLPVSELRVALNGGRTTGVFLNRQDLCFALNSESAFNTVDSLVKFYGHSAQHNRRDGQGKGQRLRAGRHGHDHRCHEHPPERARQGAEAPGLS